MTDLDEFPAITGSGSSDALPEELAAAVVAMWAELGNLPKGKTADAGKYRYTYSDLGDLLEMARPVLAKHGLALLQPIRRDGQVIVIDTILLHSSGHRLSWPFQVHASGTPQQIGSAITYGRRYSAQAALGVASEDDDGQAAAKQSLTVPTPTPVPDRVGPGPSSKQTKHAMALFGELGLAARNDRLATTSRILDRTVESWADITPREAVKVIDALIQMRDDETQTDATGDHDDDEDRLL
jgi:hypothetical protein